MRSIDWPIDTPLRCFAFSVDLNRGSSSLTSPPHQSHAAVHIMYLWQSFMLNSKMDATFVPPPNSFYHQGCILYLGWEIRVAFFPIVYSCNRNLTIFERAAVQVYTILGNWFKNKTTCLNMRLKIIINIISGCSSLSPTETALRRIPVGGLVSWVLCLQTYVWDGVFTPTLLNEDDRK